VGFTALVIAIHLVVPATVPESTVAVAQQVATAILQSAGIQPFWVPCRRNTPCLHLQVLDKNIPVHGDTTGYTVAGYAVVSYPAATTAAASCGESAAVVLGAAMAHELGHLLLPAPSHSATGVMSPRLTCRELKLAARGELRFTSDQIRAIRNASNAR
jgi:hypothetical protein